MCNEEGKFVTCVTEHHVLPVVWEHMLRLNMQVSSQLTKSQKGTCCLLKDQLRYCLTSSFVSVLSLHLCKVEFTAPLYLSGVS